MFLHLASIKPSVIEVVTVLISLLSFILSVRILSVQKRQVYASIFPRSRIEWIVSMRGAIVRFIEAYSIERTLDPGQRFLTQAAKLEIDLHMFYGKGVDGKINKTYTDLRDVLLEYLQAPSDDPITDHGNLVDNAQAILNEPFVRAKREAGISEHQDKSTSNKFLNKTDPPEDG